MTRAFTSCRCPVAPGGGTGPTVSVLSFVGRVPPRGADFGAADNCGMHRAMTFIRSYNVARCTGCRSGSPIAFIIRALLSNSGEVAPAH